nr:hypothetical protein [Roseibium sp. CAU 1639]
MFSWFYHRDYGRELYVSDGTSGSFSRVLDINVGTGSSYVSSSKPSAALGNSLIFIADDGSTDDEELWVSDGTAGGTFALTGTGTTFGAYGSYRAQMQATDELVFFTGYSSTGPELYVTDGTLEGTQTVLDLPLSNAGNIRFLGGWNNGLLFSSSDMDGSALWYSDGTAAGTFVLHNPSPDTNQFNVEITFAGFAELDVENLAPRRIDGTAGADRLVGSLLKEEVYGLAGNDTIIGGAGADIIDGGEGSDTADYSASSGGVAVNLAAGYANGGDATGDTLTSIENLTGTNFNDTLRGDDGGNIISGGQGRDILDGQGGLDTVDYSTSSAGVAVNLGVNYAGGGDATGDRISNFERIRGSEHDDRLVGSDAGNRLFGGAGNDFLDGGGSGDLLYGEGGNDILVGGAGADFVDGGVGKDTADYSSSSAGVAINLKVGYANGGDATGDTLTSIENLIGSNYNDTLRGDEGNNVLAGGLGRDLLDGQGGLDTADYSTSSAGVAINLAAGYASGGEATGDTLTSIENLTGTNFNDTLRGDDSGNIISGGQGRDILDGQGGLDTVDYSTSSAGVAVNLGVNYAGGGDATGDRISNFERIRGSEHDDRLVGSDAGNRLFGGAGNDFLDGGGSGDLLYGEGGNDILVGGAGADFVDGGVGKDTADYSSSSAGVAINLKVGYANGGDATGDTLTSIENLIGSNYNDTLRGDEGNNVLAGGLGRDLLDGQGGLDTADYSTSSAGVAINLAAGYASGGDATGDTLASIENITGSGNGDVLRGDEGENTIEGGQGNDILTGNGSSDTFVFKDNDGHDRITDFDTAADLVELSGIAGFGSFTDVQAALTQDGSDTVLDFGDGQTIRFDDTFVNSLTSDDFSFL